MADWNIAPRGLSRRRLIGLAAAGAASAWLGRTPRQALAGTSGAAQQTLANGLTVVALQRTSADVVAVQHTTLAGARDDGDAPASTVLTSRMLLQGSPRYPTEIDVKRAATLAGGSISRGTTTEYSYIAAVMPSSGTETAFDVISDAVINPLFDPQAFLGQQQVALSDLAQRQADPTELIADLLQQTMFAGQPLANPPLGTADAINALTIDILQANRARLWGAANTVLTVVGNKEPDDVFDLANQYFSGMTAGTANVRTPTVLTPPASAQTVQATAGQQEQFLIGFLAPSLHDQDRYPLSVLTSIMSGFSGRLLQALRSDLGLSFTPYASFSPYSDAGLWLASSEVDPDNIDQALDVTRKQIQLIHDQLAQATELSDAIGALSGGQILKSEGYDSVAGQLATQQILGDVSTDEFVRQVQAVTLADVQRVAQQYLDLDHSLTVIVGPGSS
jgi:predicted Zn-dependent peptidase